MARDAIVVRNDPTVFGGGVTTLADLRVADVGDWARILMRVVACDARKASRLLKASTRLESNGREADRERVFYLGDFGAILCVR